MNTQANIVAFLRLTTLVLLYFITLHVINLIYTIGFGDWDTLILLLIALLFLISAAIVFWFYPVQFSNKLLKGTGVTEPEKSTDVKSSEVKSIESNSTQLVHAAVIILGISVFTFALIELAQWVIYYGYMNAPPEIHRSKLLTLGLFNVIARLVVAILLLTKSYWLTQFLTQLNSPPKNK